MTHCEEGLRMICGQDLPLVKGRTPSTWIFQVLTPGSALLNDRSGSPHTEIRKNASKASTHQEKNDLSHAQLSIPTLRKAGLSCHLRIGENAKVAGAL